jgi:hypothetical protein
LKKKRTTSQNIDDFMRDTIKRCEDREHSDMCREEKMLVEKSMKSLANFKTPEDIIKEVV